MQPLQLASDSINHHHHTIERDGSYDDDDKGGGGQWRPATLRLRRTQPLRVEEGEEDLSKVYGFTFTRC
eukprot:scaffold57799_cov30-Tisochrysis_lutea.AAC.4